MAKIEFRDLRADEIDCRVATLNEKGLTLLLYKDARCDMNILDESVGAFNWQRSHNRDNANCIVSIWDEEKKQWISKEDTGTESNTEKEKGLASDSFKRACFNWGIGRELYTAPFIWVSADNYKVSKKNDGKITTYDKFSVKDISIKEKKIIGLSIVNDSSKKVVYTFGKVKTKTVPEVKVENVSGVVNEMPMEVVDHRSMLRKFIAENGLDARKIVADCGLNDNSTDSDFEMAIVYAKTLVGG